jgi:hypothetical protein
MDKQMRFYRGVATFAVRNDFLVLKDAENLRPMEYAFARALSGKPVNQARGLLNNLNVRARSHHGERVRLPKIEDAKS